MSEQHDQRNSIVVDDPREVRAALRELGVPMEVLQQAVRAWQQAANGTTAFEPVTAAGSKGWFAAVGVVREAMVMLGWKMMDPYHLPLVVSPDQEVSILVTSGDAATGLKDLWPTSKNSKGKATVVQVSWNGRQMAIPGIQDIVMLSRRKQKTRPAKFTWALVVTMKDGEARGEFSLPTAVSGSSRISDWARRYILPSDENGGGRSRVSMTEPPSVDGTDDITVSVVRKR